MSRSAVRDEYLDLYAKWLLGRLDYDNASFKRMCMLERLLRVL